MKLTKNVGNEDFFFLPFLLISLPDNLKSSEFFNLLRIHYIVSFDHKAVTNYLGGPKQ